jgi:hydrogenase-4 component E
MGYSETVLKLISSFSLALIITSFGAVVTRNLRYATYIYAIQALLLTTVISLFATASPTLFLWAAVAFITKFLIITWLLLSFIKGMPEYEIKAIIGFAPSVIIVTLIVIVVFEITHKYVHFLAPTTLATEEPFRTNVAVSLIVFTLGLYGILTRRDAFKTAIGLCLLENGAHLSLVSLAPGLKETVIIGIVTDVVLGVYLLLFIIRGLREVAGTTDTYQLTELHW